MNEKERLKTWLQDAVIYSIGHRCLDREKKKKHKEYLDTLLDLLDRQPSEEEAQKVRDMLEGYSTASGIENYYYFDDETKDALDIIRKALGLEEG